MADNERKKEEGGGRRWRRRSERYKDDESKLVEGRKMIKKAMTRIEGWGGVGGRVGGGEEGGRAPTRRGGRRHSAPWCSPCGTSWSRAVWAERRRPLRSCSLKTRCPWPPARCECWAAPCISGRTRQEEQRDKRGGGLDEKMNR